MNWMEWVAAIFGFSMIGIGSAMLVWCALDLALLELELRRSKRRVR